jgi:flagellar hook-basal body complex protein FliE
MEVTMAEEKKIRKHFTLSPIANSVLNQITESSATTDSVSNILDNILIEKGIELEILELDESRQSIYESKKIKTKYTESQTTFEKLLNSTRRDVAECSQKTEKDIRDLERRISDIEQIVYQIRDMMNSFITFSFGDMEASSFKSSDKFSDKYEPHILQKMSEENYNKRQERFAVEKANNAQRSPYGGGRK